MPEYFERFLGATVLIVVVWLGMVKLISGYRFPECEGDLLCIGYSLIMEAHHRAVSR